MLKIVKQFLIGIIFSLIIFGWLWKNLDDKYKKLLEMEQKIANQKAELVFLYKQLEKEKLELNELEKSLKSKENILKKKEKDLLEKQKKLMSEELLNDYISQFVFKYGDIDLHIKCLSDKEYMAKYNKAKTLLDAIEAKAKELRKTEILEQFVLPRKSGVFYEKEKCD